MGMHRMSTMKRQQLAIALAGLGMMGVARCENSTGDAAQMTSAPPVSPAVNERGVGTADSGPGAAEG